MPEIWLDLARDARGATNALLGEDRFRCAVSRAYYAAYCKVTHELVSIAGLPMPPGREGPGHSRIRTPIESSMPNMAQDKRAKLSELVGRLYTMRLDADYKPSIRVANSEARTAVSIMNAIFNSF